MVEETEVMHGTVATVVAATISCKFPVQGLTWAIAAVVVREWVSFQEPKK